MNYELRFSGLGLFERVGAGIKISPACRPFEMTKGSIAAVQDGRGGDESRVNCENPKLNFSFAQFSIGFLLLLPQ